MKRVMAFLIALAMMVMTAMGYHLYCNDKIAFNNNKFGTWINSSKFKSPEAIKANINKDTMVVMGSSELRHCNKTKYHPQQMFNGSNFNMMLIGEGYNQNLFHAITLAAIEPSLEKKKVVLVLSPQWFRKGGVKPEAYASRFSENSFVEMLKNPKLSNETKEYIIKRSEKLLKNDPKMVEKVKNYDKVILQDKGNAIDNLKCYLNEEFLREREKQSIIASAKAAGIKHNENINLKDIEPNWEEYLLEVDKEGMKDYSNNDFSVKNQYFNWRLKAKLKERKNSGLKGSYSKSIEYDDFRCFLNVCKELDIEPLIISVPVNGKWYDYTGFKKEKRDEYYNNIRDIVNEYNVEIADFSDKEYTDYFLEDTIHLGKKGWVYVNESIYNFSKQNKRE